MDKAWIVAVDMGYGHQRAAYPLRQWSPTGKVIIANNYEGIPKSDSRTWTGSRRAYEFFSRMSNLPIIGGAVFGMLDHFQEIKEFYPHRDLSAPNIQVKQMYSLISRGFGRDLINYLNQDNIPLITTFFITAFMAEEHGFKNDIYTVVCDSDISRAWVPYNPAKSRIKFLAPCRRVVSRLREYGVKDHNIFLTGFPLPQENLGDGLRSLKTDLAERIINLDPQKMYRSKYGSTVKEFLHDIKLDARHHHPLTITFAVGGAGAQRFLAEKLLRSLKKKIASNHININLVAGTRNDVYVYFKNCIKSLDLEDHFGHNLRIIYAMDKEDYFREMNAALRSTDILWSKPSEMVFYSALGLPIIMAPSLGSQEVYNRNWLKTIGAGISQQNPDYTVEWLFDWVDSGWFAEAAMSGYLDGRQFGVDNIADVVFRGREPAKNHQLL